MNQFWFDAGRSFTLHKSEFKVRALYIAARARGVSSAREIDTSSLNSGLQKNLFMQSDSRGLESLASQFPHPVIRLQIDSHGFLTSYLFKKSFFSPSLFSLFNYVPYEPEPTRVSISLWFGFRLLGRCPWTTHTYFNTVFSRQFVRVSTKRPEHQEEALGRRDDDH